MAAPRFAKVVVAVALATVASQDYEVSRACKTKCNEIVSEMPQGLDCRTYRMTLPRPKVGKACTTAYDDGAFAACTAICDGQPVPEKNGLMGTFCRKYLSDYPKPLIHKACRMGYATGFDKSAKASADVDFTGVSPYVDAPDAPPVTIETKRETPPEPPAKKADAPPPPKKEEPKEPAGPKLLVNMPVTVDDQEIFLQIFEGDDAVAKVASFCAEFMSDSADSCVRQLTPHVEKKLGA